VVENEIYEEELGKELEKTLSVHQLLVLAASEKVEIPDSQEATPMERTNVGQSQLWNPWYGEENPTEDQVAGGQEWKDEHEMENELDE